MQQALETVEEFKVVNEKLSRKLIIEGRSESCRLNYLRQVSKLVLHYKKSPLDVTIDELEEYLYYLKKSKNYSMSSFKHLIYGLKHVYKIFKLEDLKVSLPQVEISKRLPVVLSRAEVKMLLCSPNYFKHRILLGLIYDGGLRMSEIVKLRISDVDFERKTVHVRQSKFKKDRYVPISDMMIRGLRKYLKKFKPNEWLFNGREKNVPLSKGGVRYAFRAA